MDPRDIDTAGVYAPLKQSTLLRFRDSVLIQRGDTVLRLPVCKFKMYHLHCAPGMVPLFYAFPFLINALFSLTSSERESPDCVHTVRTLGICFGMGSGDGGGFFSLTECTLVVIGPALQGV